MIQLLALSLGADAFAVAISCGMTTPGFTRRHAFLIGAYFGVFQAGMTLLGAFLGIQFADFTGRMAAVIAFALLTFIGGRMCWGAISVKKKAEESSVMPKISHGRFVVLAIATSIDAMAAGVGLALLQQVNLIVAAIVIGVVAFSLSVLGGLSGKRLGKQFARRAELAGGLILIALGIRALF